MIAALVAGCGGSSTTKTTTDGGIVVQVQCTANAKSCLNSTVALVCTSDGTALIGVPCASGDICTAGVCAADPAAPCTASQNTCMDSATALQCASTGKGFNVVKCPTNTVCNEGVCYGQNAVGATQCANNYTATQTTTDGYTYTTTACATGTLCVDVYSGNVDQATCLPAECSPVTQGCGPASICGNPKDSTVSAVTSYSTCTETPLGWKWLTATCGANTTCDNTNSCGGNYYATCRDGIDQECTPGQTQCQGDGYITCGANGTWNPTATTCASATTPSNTCINTGNGAVCGDSACAGHNAGVCDSAGKYHTCNADFSVNATATACTPGLCSATGSPDVAGYRAGSCIVQCKDGDERCTQGGYGQTYQVCAGGLWGAATSCDESKGTATCFDTTTSENRPTVFCGTCLPGSTKCDVDAVQTCGTNGTWGADTACTTGTCYTTYNGVSDVSFCRAQCIPGSLICTGNGVQDPVSQQYGTTQVATCSAAGLIGTPTDCAAGQLCRTGPSSNGQYNYTPDGVVLGCVVCVGGKNAFGLPDTRCSNVDDTATSYVGNGGYVETCLPDSSGWDLAHHYQCVAPSTYCQDASYYINLDINSTSTSPYSNAPFPANCGGDTHNDGD